MFRFFQRIYFSSPVKYKQYLLKLVYFHTDQTKTDQTETDQSKTDQFLGI